MSATLRMPGPEVARRWEELLAQNQKLRPREAAASLGVSEAELIASGIGRNARRLRPDWEALLLGLQRVVRVTTLTRNDSVVHEKTGTWQNVEVSPMHALVLDPAIDLRLFPRAWQHAFAVTGNGPHGPRHSVQIFDGSGLAMIKVFVAEGGSVEAYESLVASLLHEDQSPDLAVSPAREPEAEQPDDAIDTEAFRAAWRGLQDTHDFYPLLRRFKLGRTQALRLGGEGLAWKAPLRAFREALTRAAAIELPIMIFVGNPGSIQIHTGPVARIQDVGPWLNVLDPDFNLHLIEADITEAWAVRKPTVDGIVSSLELFDSKGQAILQMFGKRKPGSPELLPWRELLEVVAPPPATRG